MRKILLFLTIIIALILPPAVAAPMVGGLDGGSISYCNCNVTAWENVTATINVNWTFTGAPGTSALVQNTGTPYAALLDFTIPRGEQGLQGIQGVNGTQGEQGPQGLQGVNGTPGVQGPQGLQGVNGTPGVQGPQGIQGLAGPQGIPGTNGTAATIVVNNTVTLPEGSSATVANVGTSSDARFDFGIPRGQQGVNGTEGAQGPTGPMGPMNQTANMTPGSFGFMPGADGQVIFNAGGNLTSDAMLAWSNTTGRLSAPRFTGDGGLLTNITVGTSVSSEGLVFQNGTRPMTDALDAGFNRVVNGTLPNATGDLTTKGYVDAAISSIASVSPNGLLFQNGTRPATGSIDAGFYRLTNGTLPNSTGDLTTKGYVDAAVSGASSVSPDGLVFQNGTRPMTGSLDAGFRRVTNGTLPNATGDLTTKGYVDTALSSIDHGSLTGLADDDHTQYYRADTTRPLTGQLIHRDVNNSALMVTGGVNYAVGAAIYLYGKDHGGAGRFDIYVPDGTGTNAARAFSITGNTKNPVVYLVDANRLTGIKTISAATDATNKSYVDSAVSGVSFVNDSYYPRDTSLPLTGDSIRLNANNNRLNLYGGTTLGDGGRIVIRGANYGALPGYIDFYVPNAAKSSEVNALTISGNTNTPVINVHNFQVTGLKTISGATDAVNKSYTDTEADEAADTYVTGEHLKHGVIRLTAGNFSTTSSSAVNITSGSNQLKYTMSANQGSRFHAYLNVGGGASAGCRYAISIPSGATMNAHVFGDTVLGAVQNYGQSQLVTSNALSATYFHQASDDYGMVQIDGTVITGANGGDVALKTAAVSGASSSNVIKGSYIEWDLMANNTYW